MANNEFQPGPGCPGQDVCMRLRRCQIDSQIWADMGSALNLHQSDLTLRALQFEISKNCGEPGAEEAIKAARAYIASLSN